MRAQLAGHDMPAPGFVGAADGSARFEEDPASPAWRRALEIGAHARRN